MHSRLFAALVLASAVAVAGCTSSETSLVAPTGAKCQVSANASPVTFTAAGGSGSLQISAARDCSWSVLADANWVSINGTRDGQGEATLTYSVAANTVPNARSAAITVGAGRVQLSQEGVPCRFDLSRTRDSIGAAGGRLDVGVTTISGCAWSASSAVSWISVVSGQSGTASGSVVMSVAANTDMGRTGTVTIAGVDYIVSQDGKGGAPPPPPPPPPDGGSSVSISGLVGSVIGGCPNVTFTLGADTVIADKHTHYKDMDCKKLKPGFGVAVDGTRNPDQTVSADQITKIND